MFNFAYFRNFRSPENCHKKYERAVETKDSSFVQKLFDDQMTITGGDGTRRNKQQEMADLVSPQYEVHYFRTENVEVKIYDKNVAVLLGELKWDHTYQGNRSTTERNITFVYLKIKNDWKIISQSIHRRGVR